MTSPDLPTPNPDSELGTDLTDLLRFAHWGSSFTLTTGEEFIDYVTDVTDAVYPNIADQPEEGKSL